MGRVLQVLSWCSLLVLVTTQLYEGSLCTYNGEPSRGICVNMRHCQTVLDMIEMGSHHNLSLCDWDGLDQVVCCDPSQLRKSYAACLKYSIEEPTKLEDLIYYGTDAKEGEYPHMVGLLYQDDKFCGGSLISENFILTAAHCMINNITPVVASMGKIKLDDDKISNYSIAQIIVHENYNNSKKLNDIALVRLAEPVQFTNTVRPACLYLKEDNPKRLTITGWGSTQKSGFKRTNVLQKAQVMSVDIETCKRQHANELFPIYLTDNHFCAKSINSTPMDTCSGDSGGPIQTLNLGKNTSCSIVAVTSFGKGCGGQLPGIYLRVSRYVKWIEKHVWP